MEENNMAKLAYIPFYFDDFERDTALLPSDDLRMKYLRLLWASYQQDNQIPADEATIARLSGIERVKGWRNKVALLTAFFDVSSGFLSQKRVGVELKKLNGNKTVKADSGSGTEIALFTRTRTISRTKEEEILEHGRETVALEVFQKAEAWANEHGSNIDRQIVSDAGVKLTAGKTISARMADQIRMIGARPPPRESGDDPAARQREFDRIAQRVVAMETEENG